MIFGYICTCIPVFPRNYPFPRTHWQHKFYIKNASGKYCIARSEESYLSLQQYISKQHQIQHQTQTTSVLS